MKKKNKKIVQKPKGPRKFVLPEETKKWIGGVVMVVLAAIVALSFFDLAGVAGKTIMASLTFLIGKAVFVIPLILILGGLVFLNTQYKKFFGPTILALCILILGVCSVLSALAPESRQGGWIGYVFSWPFLKFFGFWVTQIIFGGVIVIGGLIFWHLLRPSTAFLTKEEKLKLEKERTERGKPLIARLVKKVVGEPKFKVKEISSEASESWRAEDRGRPSGKAGQFEPKAPALELRIKEVPQKAFVSEYQPPSLELLEREKEIPAAGDTRINSAIIKKTLENFGLQVEMSEINTGPTVTQYTLKPAEGIKLSKITSLSNDLSLALASHPIRIEAPIPGKSLVGIEVPNKARAQVRLRDLISNPPFLRSASNLTLTLGRDVAGNALYADLAKMPHLLVAGSTGTGKTIFLNSLILSLLYQNGPEILKFILIDPKRVEFLVYNGLPHLLTPVILDAQKAVNVLKWLISEMERRFNVLSAEQARDIASYNEIALKSKGEFLPYIVLIIDELADLMAARGRDMEAGIVRLAQMARAVGIHLVVATQRPSVEVITGLIKANITSRVTFQVASQVDSRTVLDAAGAEKLLGWGDLLFVSAEIVKPRRIQGAYVSEKEVKRVVNYIKAQSLKLKDPALDYAPSATFTLPPDVLSEGLKRTLESPETELEGFYGEEDPLYEEAKKVVIERRRASASLLQRRLRIGYARAARLIDVLEERGVVGPGEGAKPREVYVSPEGDMSGNPAIAPEGDVSGPAIKTDEEDNGWQKV